MVGGTRVDSGSQGPSEDRRGKTVENNTETSAASSVWGMSLWRWDGSTWELKHDYTTADGQMQKPQVVGAFDGQFRAIASKEA